MAPVRLLEQRRTANKTLAGYIKVNPERFTGLALPPIGKACERAGETRRYIQDLGFVGRQPRRPRALL